MDRSAANLMCLPLWVKDLLSLAAFQILSLSLYFASLTMVCHGVDMFLLILREFSVPLGLGCLLPFPDYGSSQLYDMDIVLFHGIT